MMDEWTCPCSACMGTLEPYDTEPPEEPLWLTLNENCGHLQGYPALVVKYEPPYFWHVRPQGCVDVLRLTPGHFQEEDRFKPSNVSGANWYYHEDQRQAIS